MSSRSWQEILDSINYDEDKVPLREIPSVLIKNDGSSVDSVGEWMNVRRQEVLDFYRDNVYGKFPPPPQTMSFETVSCKENALGGKAFRKEIKITFSHGGDSRSWLMLLYIPKNAVGKVPVVLGLNFRGNHTVTDETDVTASGRDCNGDLVDEQRGIQSCRWEFAKVIERGFASATLCYHDVFPDFPTAAAWKKSIYGLLFPEKTPSELNKDFSAIGAWAWALSKMLDVLESEKVLDCRKVMVTGHSRLGKTALWAGANDLRFSVVVSNDSGHGGAALFKRCLGESIEVLNDRFPHWFVSEFKKYDGVDADLSFDQHFLLSLIAPRALCIGSATEDLWADPKGEFLAGVYASEVYRLFGVQGMPVSVHPAADVNVTGSISYHLRTGAHNILWQDWDHYLSAAEKFFDR